MKGNRGIRSRIREACLNTPLFYFLVFLVFLEPSFLKTQTVLWDNLFDLGNLVLFAVLLIFYDWKKLSGFDVCLALMGLLLMESTVWHTGISSNIWKAAKYLWPAAAMVMMTEEGIWANKRALYRGVYVAAFFNIIVNLLTQLLFPDGLYLAQNLERHYWLGHDSEALMYMLAGMAFGFLDIQYRNFKKDFPLYCLLCLISSVIVNYLTSVLALTAVGILYFLSRISFFEKIISLKNALLVWAAMFLTLPVLRLHKIMEPVVVNLLHRTMDLSHRTYIWDCALDAIRKSPLTGYGVLSPQEFYLLIPGAEVFMNCHNYLLELLMWAGPLMLILFLILLFMTARNTDACRKDIGIRNTIIVLLGYFFGLTVTTYEMRTAFYLVLALAFHSHQILEATESPKVAASAPALSANSEETK